MRTSSRSPDYVDTAQLGNSCISVSRHSRPSKRRLLDPAGTSAALPESWSGMETGSETIDHVNDNAFDSLSDDLVVSILVCLASSSASTPADLISSTLTCKRFHALGMHTTVLTNASTASLAVRASEWSDGAHRFMRRCAENGNMEACFTLGMIRFYCLEDRRGGVRLLVKAAVASHARALLSLAIIQFNGSGGGTRDKNAKAAVALCARAAQAGSLDSIRELGHCLQDGHGLPTDAVKARRFLLEANTREVRAFLSNMFKKRKGLREQQTTEISTPPPLRHMSTMISPPPPPVFDSLLRDAPPPAALEQHHNHRLLYELLHQQYCRSLLSDYGCTFPSPWPAENVHPANIFLMEWFALHPLPEGLRLCSHANCGRPETRKHEFRRCSACGTVNYCCRACQAMDWKLRHKLQCKPILNADFDEDHDHRL